VAPARASAAITLHALLHPARAARLLRFHDEDPANPPLSEVTGAVVDRASGGPPGALRRAVREVAVARLMEVAAAPSTDAGVRAAYEAALRELARRLRAVPSVGIEAADRRSTAEAITRFLERPVAPRAPAAVPSIPPGPPIG
jgi:hypothetical protein